MAKGGQGLRGPKTFEDEPERHPDLQINAKEPFNAEPPPGEITKSFTTPIPMFYKRNHGPIPVLDDPQNYKVEIGGLVPTPIFLTVDQIKSLPKYTVVATLMCAGNRRTEMSLKKKVKGVGWGLGAIGNATWSGAKLADVLALAGVPFGSRTTPMGGRHVEFISVDVCPEEGGGPYKGSVPLLQGTSPEADVLVAYEMNGEELNRDHGFPLRMVVPGVIGARSVKWLKEILVRADECQGFFMQRDYKMFPPSVDWHNVDWPSRRPIQDYPIQSAICQPADNDVVAPGTPTVIRGYATSGGGRGIERVDVSVDGGRTWAEAARLPQTDQVNWGPYVADDDLARHKWAWVLWEIPTTLNTPCEIVVRAVDSAASTQPENVDHIWNLRGVLNNSWHRIQVAAPQGLARPTNGNVATQTRLALASL